MTEIAIDWASIESNQLDRMLEAGRDVMECHRVLMVTSDNVVGELLKAAEGFFEWSHYPAGDVYDRHSHAQFYYHAHAQEENEKRDWIEHGHFHTFMRPKGMPEGVAPMPVDGFEMPEDPNDALSHLIAISMDQYGFAQHLFTTNRWVTGEVFYDADAVIAMLDNFLIDHAQPSWPVNRWVSGMITLFRPQIEVLVRQRDETLKAWIAAHPGEDVYEDRELEVTSMTDIRVEEQMRAITEELGRRRVAA